MIHDNYRKPMKIREVHYKRLLDQVEVYLIQQYVIKCVNEMRQVAGFLRVLTNKTDRHDITGILLKVALNTINLNTKRTLPIYIK
jgi:hypothetical protein